MADERITSQPPPPSVAAYPPTAEDAEAPRRSWAWEVATTVLAGAFVAVFAWAFVVLLSSAGTSPKEPEPLSVADIPKQQRIGDVIGPDHDRPEQLPAAAIPKRHPSDQRGAVVRPPLAAESIFAQGSPAVVKVVIQDRRDRTIGTGSGFLVSKSGLVATNHHVIKRADTAHVVLVDKTKLPVLGVAALDEEADLAIIFVAGHIGAQPLELAGDDLPPVGAKVYAIGSPLGFLANTLSDGLVSGHREIHRITVIQTTAPLSPGSSGGPLLGPDGRVVGVTTFGFKGGQNLNFAVPAYHVARLLLRCEAEGQLTNLPLPGAAAAEERDPRTQAPPPLPQRDEIAEKVVRIKLRLRFGTIKVVELEEIMEGRHDKLDTFLPDAFIPEFNRDAGLVAIIRRYFPFEVPGVAEPRYRVNLLFQDFGDGNGLRLTSWYYRSPN